MYINTDDVYKYTETAGGNRFDFAGRRGVCFIGLKHGFEECGQVFFVQGRVVGIGYAKN